MRTNILTDASKISYNYTSRYATIPYYYNTVDKKYMYGITKNVSKNCDFVKRAISDIDTLDSLALEYYGRPDLFWFIAAFNNINDPYIKLSDYFEYILIPSITGLKWE